MSRKYMDLYTQPATTSTPALIIYLVDTSDSMNQRYGSGTKIELVNIALRDSIRRLMSRSMRDGSHSRSILLPFCRIIRWLPMS